MTTGGNLLLRALSPADREALHAHLEPIGAARGDVLHEHGDEVSHVYFPHDGMISLVAVMSNGATAEAASIGVEGVVGALSALARRPATTRAVVQMQGGLSRMDAGRLRTLAGERPQLRAALDRWLDVHLSQSQQFSACNLLHLMEARLARWILSCHDRVEGDEVVLTQEFLGQMLGVRRTTVTEVAGELQTRGMIKHRRGAITILDKDRLEQVACECRQTVRRELDELWAHPLAAERG